MRGNHHILGRNDYVEPSPMPEAELHQVCAVEVRLVEGKKTWKAAYLDGVHIGYVTTRLAGQSYRTLDMDDWMYVASDWNRNDPPHAHAINGLLNHLSAN